jgi:hypothetical protein
MFIQERQTQKRAAAGRDASPNARILAREYCPPISAAAFAREPVSTSDVFIFSPFELNRLHRFQDTPGNSQWHEDRLTNQKEIAPGNFPSAM